MNLLLRSSFCVCEMEKTLGLPQPLISRHLAYLRNGGLVESHRDGMRVNYNLNRNHPFVEQLWPFLMAGERCGGAPGFAHTEKRRLCRLEGRNVFETMQEMMGAAPSSIEKAAKVDEVVRSRQYAMPPEGYGEPRQAAGHPSGGDPGDRQHCPVSA